jgi:bifunctional non-homologous end joining protein LigD
VVAPIEPTPVDACLEFARGLAAALVRDAPARFTTANAKAGRERKILLDVLRNNRTNTSVAAYSLRARPGAPVSWPLDWDELGPRLRPGAFTLETVPQRLRRGVDPWRTYWTIRQRLPLIGGGGRRGR